MMTTHFRRRASIASVFFLSVVGLTLGQLHKDDPHEPSKLDRGIMEQCAKACNECQRLCDMCAAHCGTMLMDGHKQHFATLRTCQDCAAICSAAAQIVARHGPFSVTICQACVTACNRCATACEKGGQDATMKQCGEECRRCAKACQVMIKKHGESQGQ